MRELADAAQDVAQHHSQLAFEQQPRTNWAGNYTFMAAALRAPESLEALQELVRAGAGRGEPLKALGAGHSFHGIADTTGTQVSLRHFGAMALDAEAGTVTVGGGVSYGQLAPWLQARGFAVHNLASLPHISIAGACATATHGSGVGNGSLATAVRALELVDGSGELVRLSRERDPETFAGAVVSLGALGLVTSLTLAVQPTFQVAQAVYRDLPFAELEHHYEAILAGGYSVSLFTGWQGSRVTQAWVKRRMAEREVAEVAPDFWGARLQQEPMHPLDGEHRAENCTPQMGVAGPWFERLPHFRMEFTPSSGEEMQTEYFVPRERGMEAILAVDQLGDVIAPHLLVSELRTVAADDQWLSMAYGRDSLALHFTWKPDWPPVRELLPRIEAALEPFAYRPHWAKLFSTPVEQVRAMYPRLPEFLALRSKYDPAGRFSNAFLRESILGD